MSHQWRVKTPCADCPFNKSGDGLHLRKSLAKGRWQEIISGLKRDGHFTCHKTTHETGNGSNLICAGALDWQAEHGYSSQYARICERLER